MGSIPRRRQYRFVVAIALFMTGIAGLGTYVAQHQLDTALERDARGDLARGREVFDLVRAHALDAMRGQCRLLVEDPRLKSTLATAGIDEATVADILSDLGRLRGTGMLVVLWPDGHVFAESGASELRGLDLSASSVVKKAEASSEAVAGSWVIGNRIIDLAIMGIRFDSSVIAYLVVGQAIDSELVKAVGAAAGTGIAIAVGSELTLVSDERWRALTSLAQRASFASQRLELAGEPLLVALGELEQMGQARPRLAVIRPLAPALEAFATVRWLMWLSPVLVLIAIVLATSRPHPRAS